MKKAEEKKLPFREHLRDKVEEAIAKGIADLAEEVASECAESYGEDAYDDVYKEALAEITSDSMVFFFGDEAGAYVEVALLDRISEESRDLRVRLTVEDVFQLSGLAPDIDKPDGCKDDTRFREMTLESVRAWLAEMSKIEARLLANRNKKTTD